MDKQSEFLDVDPRIMDGLRDDMASGGAQAAFANFFRAALAQHPAGEQPNDAHAGLSKGVTHDPRRTV